MSERSIGLLEAEMIINPKANVKIYLTIYIYIHTHIYITIVKVSQNNFS